MKIKCYSSRYVAVLAAAKLITMLSTYECSRYALCANVSILLHQKQSSSLINFGEFSDVRYYYNAAEIEWLFCCDLEGFKLCVSFNAAAFAFGGNLLK